MSELLALVRAARVSPGTLPRVTRERDERGREPGAGGLVITARRCAGRGVGSALLDHARLQAQERDIGLLRLDCWAGGEGRLPAYYMSAGFTPTVGFNLDGWPGQLLEQRVQRKPARSSCD